MRIDSSLLAEAISVEATATRLTQSVCYISVCRQAPLTVSQTLSDWSREHDTKKSGCEGTKARPDTSCSWPRSVFYTAYFSKLHSLIAISVAQDARTCPPGWNARNLTTPVWPLSVRSCSPYSRSHSLIVASSLADASIGHEGCKTTFVTLPLCPTREYFSGSLGSPSPVL